MDFGLVRSVIREVQRKLHPQGREHSSFFSASSDRHDKFCRAYLHLGCSLQSSDGRHCASAAGVVILEVAKADLKREWGA